MRGILSLCTDYQFCWPFCMSHMRAEKEAGYFVFSIFQSMTSVLMRIAGGKKKTPHVWHTVVHTNIIEVFCSVSLRTLYYVSVMFTFRALIFQALGVQRGQN